jgi:hypothetical protein
MAVNSIRFNQDSSCFAVGCQDGFRLFNSDPLKQILHADLKGGIGLVEPLFRRSLVALVGGGDKPAFDPNKG